MNVTQFIAENATEANTLSKLSAHQGQCAFCGTHGPGVHAEDAINERYFSDSPLMQADTGHICECCARCMSTKALKNGHWIATPAHYESVSTGDLPEALGRVRSGEIEPPLAIHVSDNPIRSEHAYLWTPIADTTDWLLCDYDHRTIRIEWDDLETLVRAVEDCRWHGMRLDDIRSGQPRVADLHEMGRTAYRRADDVIGPHRGTPELELALTLSNPADGQDRPRTTNGNATLNNYV